MRDSRAPGLAFNAVVGAQARRLSSPEIGIHFKSISLNYNQIKYYFILLAYHSIVYEIQFNLFENRFSQ